MATNAKYFLKDEGTQASLQQLQQQIRNDPANPELRIFLFQLLAVMGDWQRSLTQLEVVGEMEASSLPMVQTYRELIRCEVFREGVFSGKRQALIFGEPEKWLALLVEALAVEANNTEQAVLLREQALELAPTIAGQINQQDFDWIADADSRLGPILEVIINGRYYWVPFNRIKTIQIEEPIDLRDMVWMPAHFTWSNEGETVGFIPSRYPNSQYSDDNKIVMAAKTEWLQKNEQTYHGLGQRILTTDKDDYSLFDIREITLTHPTPITS